MRIHLATLHKNFLYLAIITSFTGILWFTFSIGPFHMFPYRVVMLVLWMLLFIKNGSIDISNIRVKTSFQFLVIWLVYGILSIVWAASKIDTVKHIIFLFLDISLIFFIVKLTTDVNELMKLFYIWIGIYIVLIPIGFWEVITGDHLKTSGLNLVDEGYEHYKFSPTTLFANQNDYATLIALTIPMFYTSIRYLQNGFSRFFYLICLVLSIVMLMFTSSRANYIGVVIGFAFWFFFILKTKGRMNVIIASLSIVALLLINISDEEIKFLANVWDDFNVLMNLQDEDAGVDIRSNLIKNGLWFALNSGGFGIGAGNIEYYMANFPKYDVGDTTNVHNWWIELLTNYGVVIFIGYLIFYVSIIWRLWKYIYKVTDYRDKIIVESLLCGFISFSISSISSSSLMSFNPQWIFFGLALAFINYKSIELNN